MLILKTDFLQRARSAIGVSGFSNPQVANMIKYHQWMDLLVPGNAVIFIGDSLTQGLANIAVEPCSVNFGIGSMNTFQLIEVLPFYKSLLRASAVVLEIGVNDFSMGLQARAGFDSRYRRIVEFIPKEKPLIVNSIMPVAQSGIDAGEILAANRSIQAICKDRPGCYFLDTWALMANPDDNQPLPEMFLVDGVQLSVHLSVMGYQTWINALRKEIGQLRLIEGCEIPSERAILH